MQTTKSQPKAQRKTWKVREISFMKFVAFVQVWCFNVAQDSSLFGKGLCNEYIVVNFDKFVKVIWILVSKHNKHSNDQMTLLSYHCDGIKSHLVTLFLKFTVAFSGFIQQLLYQLC